MNRKTDDFDRNMRSQKCIMIFKALVTKTRKVYTSQERKNLSIMIISHNQHHKTTRIQALLGSSQRPHSKDTHITII